MKNLTLRLLPLLLVAGALAACRPPARDGHASGGFPVVTEAVAVLRPTEGNDVHGIVRFVQEGDRVRVEARITGLPPNSRHGFHIHEFGDATSPDGKSAGGHYNPEGHDHAGPAISRRHAGDLGNVEADAEGTAVLTLTLDNVSISGHRNPILGRGVILHAGEDDLATQPTGGAGARIGIGVIGIAAPR